MNHSEHLREISNLPAARAAAAGLVVTVAGTLLRRPREGALAGLATALAVGERAAAATALERVVRRGEDAAALATVLGETATRLGGWAIDADFGRLLGNEAGAGPEVVVEVGSGISTVLLAAALASRGAGSVVSFDHHPQFAAETTALLDRHGLSAWARVVEAPLREQLFGDLATWWYDPDIVGAALPERPIELLVVDGPPSEHTWSRWPAVEFFLPHLAPGAVILLDDGRRPEETRTARRWVADHPNLGLAWIDTVKGTWRLQVGESANRPLGRRAARNLRAAINPHPAGFGREPVPR